MCTRPFRARTTSVTAESVADARDEELDVTARFARPDLEARAALEQRAERAEEQIRAATLPEVLVTRERQRRPATHTRKRLGGVVTHRALASLSCTWSSTTSASVTRSPRKRSQLSRKA